MQDLCWFKRVVRDFRIFFAFIIAIGLLSNGCAEDRPKVYRVGILCGLDALITTVDGFKDRMTELGYLEGVNIVYDLQRTNFDSVEEERILRKFVADRVDVIFVFPAEAAIATKAIIRGTDIPAVFTHTNIEGMDLIKSVPEPGGNMTGVRYPGPDLALKRFEILHTLAPRARRMWVPYAVNSPIVPAQLEALRPAAVRAGVTLVESPAKGPADLLADLDHRANSDDVGIDAILFISEPLAKTPAVFPIIGKFASENGIPIGGALYSLEGYSTIFGVANEHPAVGRMAAQQVHKILRGIPAGTIPVVSAESYFEFNYKAAQELGLKVPMELLKQADRIIR